MDCFSLLGNNFYRLFVKRVRVAIKTFLKLTLKGNNKKFDKILIVPHEGLGDFIVIFNALLHLCDRHKVVYIAMRRSIFEQLREIFIFPENLKCIRFNLKKDYHIRQKYLKVLMGYSRLIIKLGYWNDDPVYEYPNSFYDKLGVPLVEATKKIKIRNINSEIRVDNYSYFNMKTSTKNFSEATENLKENTVKYVNLTSIEINRNLKNIDPERSLMINLYLALNSKKIYCSDGDFLIYLTIWRGIHLFVYIPERQFILIMKSFTL